MAGTRKITQTPKAAPGVKFGIVASKYHEEIVRKLVRGAERTLQACGVKRSDIVTIWTPGALELPLAVKMLLEMDHTYVSAVIALGVVIRGDTDHYQHVSEGACRGIMQVSLKLGKPVTNGVLTVHNLQQATDRADGKAGNKGSEAALAAVEMLNLKADFEKRSEILRKEWEKRLLKEVF